MSLSMYVKRFITVLVLLLSSHSVCFSDSSFLTKVSGNPSAQSSYVLAVFTKMLVGSTIFQPSTTWIQVGTTSTQCSSGMTPWAFASMRYIMDPSGNGDCPVDSFVLIPRVISGPFGNNYQVWVRVGANVTSSSSGCSSQYGWQASNPYPSFDVTVYCLPATTPVYTGSGS